MSNEIMKDVGQMIREAQEAIAASPAATAVQQTHVQHRDNGDEMGPLSRMLVDNADIVDAAIDAYGIDSVAAFFVDVGTAMASAYAADQASEQSDVTAEDRGEK